MRSGKFLAFACLVWASALPAQAASEKPISDIERLTIESDLRALSAGWARTQDFDGHDGEFVNLFTEDGVMEIAGRSRTVGREAIRKYTATRLFTAANSLQTRHLQTNFRYTIVDRNHATGEGYEVMFRYDPNHPENIKSLAPILVGTLRDEYARTPQGWKFKLRVLDAVRTTGEFSTISPHADK